MFNTLRGVWGLLAVRRKLQFALLASGMMAAGFFEMLSLGAFAPLVAALAAPQQAFTHDAFAKISLVMDYVGAGPGNHASPLTILAAFFAVLAALAGLSRILVVWANARFTAALGTDIASAVYSSCLNLSYADHLNRGSGELVSLVRDKAGQAGVVIFFLLNLVSSALIALMICAGLFFLHPWITAGTMTLMGGFYALIGWVCRKKLLHNSRVVAEESTRAVKAVQEGLGSIRDVILDGSQEFYRGLFRRAEGMVQRASAVGIFLGTAPRYFTDTFAMVVFAGILVFWLGESGDWVSTAAVLPTLGVLALGAQRSMPLLQQIYSSWAVISANSAALRLVLESVGNRSPQKERAAVPAMTFSKCFRLRNVSFRYRNDLPWVIRNLDLEIPKGSCLGIKGETGCGKSTLVDVIMGLLAPSEGSLEVDGTRITPQNVFSWQKNIAHVPQSIFLADVSISENIALGTDRSKIDMKKVREAARQACLDDFIQSSKDGYETLVGERGVRLSGGQRQRIGLARALYRKPSLLVLDEATSALDEKTELEVMESIYELKKGLTILIIAHRLSSLEACDRIIDLEQGRILLAPG